ncbi:uncharacterized protein LOC133861229 [Alnus glutinosa]|uniref:uncharacterized protein LOC133861229 n=1 Tax=Alnus glutinosa TaxID=3517 RepID=UPI002D779E08|nr:uncharacterized protein LOC133861229 [Alnus glutinosa]
MLGGVICVLSVGLWVLASFIHHSYSPNARRLHVGDFVMVHTSRDVVSGEEITLAYCDALSSFNKRREMSKTWGFHCNSNRCKFEKEMCAKQEIREIGLGLESGVIIRFHLHKRSLKQQMSIKRSSFQALLLWY